MWTCVCERAIFDSIHHHYLDGTHTKKEQTKHEECKEVGVNRQRNGWLDFYAYIPKKAAYAKMEKHAQLFRKYSQYLRVCVYFLYLSIYPYVFRMQIYRHEKRFTGIHIYIKWIYSRRHTYSKCRNVYSRIVNNFREYYSIEIMSLIRFSLCMWDVFIYI